MVGIYLSGTGNTKYCIEKLVSLIHSSAKAIPMESPEVSRPRQHRHLKRKNSILFLVFLDFPHFFIHSGWQDTLF